MSGGLRPVTVKLHSEMFGQIKVMAEKRGESISDTIRYLMKRGLDERVYEENAALIAQVVRTQVENAIKSYVIFPTLDNTNYTARVVQEVFENRATLCRIPKNIQN